MLGVISSVPVWILLFSSGLVGVMGAMQTHTPLPAHFTQPNFLLLFLFGLGAYAWAYVTNGAIIVAASDAYLHDTVEPLQALRTSLGHAPAMLLAGLLFIIPMALGAIVFVVGMFYVMTRYFAVIPAILLEDKGPVNAFHRSRDLSQGFRWRIFATAALAWVICLIVLYTLQTVAGLLPITPVGIALVNAVVGLLVTPLVWIVITVLYYDQRIRKDAFDLEMMAQQLTPAPAVS